LHTKDSFEVHIADPVHLNLHTSNRMGCFALESS